MDLEGWAMGWAMETLSMALGGIGKVILDNYIFPYWFHQGILLWFHTKKG